MPAQFERVLRRGLELEPDARFADMGSLLRALVGVPEFIGRRRQVRVAVFGLLGSGLCGPILALLLAGVFKAEPRSQLAEKKDPSAGINPLPTATITSEDVAGDGDKPAEKKDPSAGINTEPAPTIQVEQAGPAGEILATQSR